LREVERGLGMCREVEVVEVGLRPVEEVEVAFGLLKWLK